MRYIPATDQDHEAMLRRTGGSLDHILRTIPAKVREKAALKLPLPLDELSLRKEMRAMSTLNANADALPSFLGAGTYNHFIPAVVDQLLLRSEFFTAYTPYQPEISQGTLQAIFEFQTMVCMLTGLDVANASMYDGASALAEAVLMARRIRKNANRIYLSKAIHPEYRTVVKTYTNDLDIELVEIPLDGRGRTDAAWLEANLGDDAAAVAVQYPNFFGVVEDMSALSKIASAKKALFLSATTEILSLGLLRPPADFGVDIAVADGQSLGNAASFGGPHVGLFAARTEHLRNMPGRLVGETVDLDGKRGYVLTLSTREQHIRREKATSNICSNQSLCALAFSIHLSLLGRKGLRRLAETNLALANYAKKQIGALPGFSLLYDTPTFNEFAVRCGRPAEAVTGRLLDAGIIGGLALSRFYPGLDDAMLFCFTEKTGKTEIDRLVEVLRGC